jgi:hypothetical protein
MSFSHGVVAMGVGRAPMPHLLGEGRPKPPTPLDVVRNSSVESSIMAQYGDGVPLQLEPMKAAPELPHLGERVRQPK